MLHVELYNLTGCRRSHPIRRPLPLLLLHHPLARLTPVGHYVCTVEHVVPAYYPAHHSPGSGLSLIHFLSAGAYVLYLPTTKDLPVLSSVSCPQGICHISCFWPYEASCTCPPVDALRLPVPSGAVPVLQYAPVCTSSKHTIQQHY